MAQQLTGGNGTSRPYGRLTLFHVLWLAATVSAGWVAWLMTRHLHPALRTIVVLGVTIAALITSLLLVVLLVGLLLRRIRPGTSWDFEAGAFMHSVLQSKWENAGRKDGDPPDTPPDPNDGDA